MGKFFVPPVLIIIIPNFRPDVYSDPNYPYTDAIVSDASAIGCSWPMDNVLPINLFDIASDGSPLGSNYSQALLGAVPKLLMLPSTGTLTISPHCNKSQDFGYLNRDRFEGELRGMVGKGWCEVSPALP